MDEKIDLIAFGTFGIPNGFRQTLFLGNKETFNKIKTYDLNTNAIKLFPGTKIYSIRKQQIGGINSIAYAIYSFAKEKNSDRGGTFIGISIVFHDKIAKESLILDCLNAFHEDLINNKSNVDNDVIQVNHSDHFKPFKKPKDFDKLSYNLKETDQINFSSSNKDLLVYNLIKPELFEKSLELLHVFDTIFFTRSEDIAKFVHEKKLIKLIQSQQDFENEIQGVKLQIAEDKKSKIDQAVEQIQRKINQFEEDRRQYLDKSNSLIDLGRKRIEENELLIKKFSQQHNDDRQQIDSALHYLKKINTQFDSYKTHLEVAAQELKENSKQPEEISKPLEELQKGLEEAKSRFKTPNIVKLADSQVNAFAKEPFFTQTAHKKDDPHRNTERSSQKKKTYKTIAILLFLLWIGTIAYFLFFDRGNYLHLFEQEQITDQS